MSENQFVGSMATYLVVINKLPTHPKNASLLLLSKGKKQSEFCRWLLEDGEGITIQEKLFYQFYLLRYNLIQNQEVMQKMRRTLLLDSPADYSWIFDVFDDGQCPEYQSVQDACHNSGQSHLYRPVGRWQH